MFSGPRLSFASAKWTATLLAAAALGAGCAGEGSGPQVTTTTTTLAGVTTTTVVGGAPTIEELQADIFMPSCATGGCHDDVTRAGALRLTSAENSFNDLVGVPSTCASRLRVVPSDPDASYLLHKLGDGPAPCGAIMPLGAPSLDASDIQRIRDWIVAGAAAPGAASVVANVSTTTVSTSTSSTLEE